MEEVEDLVVSPFREVAEKGKAALENAGDANPIMLKASQSLVKEGERALKRIEPLCRKHLEEYGHVFIASLKDNDEIANHRAELNDLLWEFDDFTTPEEFDVSKFAELQAVSRKAAPRIHDILMRLKLEVPMFRDDTSSRGSIAQLPTPTSPSSHSASMMALNGGSRTSVASSLDPRSIEHATMQLRDMMRPNSRADSAERPPPPPSLNPWDLNAQQSNQSADDGIPLAESPVLPHSEMGGDRVSVVHPPVQIHSLNGLPSVDSEDRRMSASSAVSPLTTERFGSFHRSRGTIVSIPENEATTQQHGGIPFFQQLGTQSPQPTPNYGGQMMNVAPPASDTESSNPDYASTFSQDSHSRVGTHSSSNFSAAGFSPMNNPLIPPAASAPEVMPSDFVGQIDSGLIPVEEEQSLSSPKSPVSFELDLQKCKIDANSSFTLGKGFCEGAREVFRGGIGVKKTKKPGFTGSATVARCVSCLYEMDFNEIETDVNKSDKGNFTRNGINFRVRFLQKSHLATKRADDVQYGCVFCVQQGHTTNECDATVFFSQKALFEHLARHPRPLPEVPGLCVIDGDRLPAENTNDYDIHFRKPAVQHPAREMAVEISRGATGTAKEPARRLFGQRLPYDRSAALELAQGARVTGLTFPPQHQGEWMLGWHDGNWASVPTDIMKLDPPPSSMVRFDSRSLLRAKARWKFSVKDKDKGGDGKLEWLKFDKNEAITNIAYVDSDFWCWTGTNAKGKSGIFPVAFLDMNTLQTPSMSTADRAGSLSAEKNRMNSQASMFSKLRSSKTQPTRRPSGTGSVSSSDTALSSTKTRRFAPPGDGFS